VAQEEITMDTREGFLKRGFFHDLSLNIALSLAKKMLADPCQSFVFASCSH
jgi:hypothetical protein